MTGAGKSDRRLPNWIESFVRYSEGKPSPKLFLKWAAISMVGAVLERKVWHIGNGPTLYPNMYIVLVGPPGVGKSVALSLSEKILRAVREIHVSPSSLTTASLIDTVQLSAKTVINPHPMVYNSLQVVASELGVFLPAYDAAFMNTLTKLYDGEFYEERRRTGKVNHIKIEAPLLSIIGGTTPSYLNGFLPEGAWDQGFTSRTVFIYSGERIRRDPFESDAVASPDEQHLIDLIHDLNMISRLIGKVNWSVEAKSLIRDWHLSGEAPVPIHGKLVQYNNRRLAHLLKLCMILAISRSDDLNVTPTDYHQALEWLLEAEAIMPDIFTSMGVSGDSRAMEDCWYAVYKIYERSKRPVGEHIIVNFLKDRVPSYNISKVIEVMVRSKMLKMTVVHGVPHYIPADPQ